LPKVIYAKANSYVLVYILISWKYIINFQLEVLIKWLCYSYCSIDSVYVSYTAQLGWPYSTWAERCRSSGQGSPKLCSITEHIPIRLDNRCFNTWNHQFFPAKRKSSGHTCGFTSKLPTGNVFRQKLQRMTRAFWQ
jgi:hypothetical protein